MSWSLFGLLCTWLVIIFIGAIAYVALRRADKALGMDINDDYDSKLWRSLLLDELLRILEYRARLKNGDLEITESEWHYECLKCGWKGTCDELVVDYDAGGSIHMCPQCRATISLYDHTNDTDHTENKQEEPTFAEKQAREKKAVEELISHIDPNKLDKVPHPK